MKQLLPLVLAFVLFVAPDTAQAQFVGSPQEVITSGTSYRIFAYPGEPTVTIQLLGDIGGSGIYVVGEETSLSQLLALAGGAPLGDPGPRTRREVTVRVFCDAAGTRQAIYEESLSTVLSEPGRYPDLRDGDLVTVDIELRERFDPMQALRFISAASSVALLIIRLADGR